MNRRKKNKEEVEVPQKPRAKQTPKTLETLRERDETTVVGEDEEVLLDQEADELAPYFDRKTVPKILITTSDKARKVGIICR